MVPLWQRIDICSPVVYPMHFLGKFIEEKEALNFEAHYLAPVFLVQVRAFMPIDLSTSSDNKASYHYSLFLIKCMGFPMAFDILRVKSMESPYVLNTVHDIIRGLLKLYV
jgi:hypothetical protein